MNIYSIEVGIGSRAKATKDGIRCPLFSVVEAIDMRYSRIP